MRLIKPDIIGHFDSKNTRYAIYTLDFQPNGKRLATGGGDYCIKLWSVDDVQLIQLVADSLLATLSNHTKSVNIVRWSKNGMYLASGSDDNYILIHRHTPGAMSNQAFGTASNVHKNRETWTRCFTLQGHLMDVVDLDWTASGLLASASVDNMIIIWDLSQAFNGAQRNQMFSALITPMKVLTGHTSFVKGLSFDPLGKYLVSCGTDNLILVWDATQPSWPIVKELSGPLKNSVDKTIFRRISWAPDGQSLCVTAALKSNKPIAAVLKRGLFSSVADLVGHSTPSISCRYCPMLLSVENVKNGQSKAMQYLSKKPPLYQTISTVVPESSKIVTNTSGKVVGNEDEKIYFRQYNKRSTRNSLNRSPVKTSPNEKEPPSPTMDGTSQGPHPDSSSSESEEDEEEDTVAVRCVVAVGDQIGTLSIWSSHSNKPLYVLRDAFNGPVTDITWNTCTHSDENDILFACCSMDGTVLLVRLSQEKKSILDAESLRKHFIKLYGNKRKAVSNYSEDKTLSANDSAIQTVSESSVQRSAAVTATTTNTVLGTSEITATDTTNATNISSSPTRTAINAVEMNVNPIDKMSPEKVLELQQHTQSRTKDGKKRIQPLLIQSYNTNSSNIPANANVGTVTTLGAPPSMSTNDEIVNEMNPLIEFQFKQNTQPSTSVPIRPVVSVIPHSTTSSTHRLPLPPKSNPTPVTGSRSIVASVMGSSHGPTSMNLPPSNNSKSKTVRFDQSIVDTLQQKNSNRTSKKRKSTNSSMESNQNGHQDPQEGPDDHESSHTGRQNQPKGHHSTTITHHNTTQHYHYYHHHHYYNTPTVRPDIQTSPPLNSYPLFKYLCKSDQPFLQATQSLRPIFSSKFCQQYLLSSRGGGAGEDLVEYSHHLIDSHGNKMKKEVEWIVANQPEGMPTKIVFQQTSTTTLSIKTVLWTITVPCKVSTITGMSIEKKLPGLHSKNGSSGSITDVEDGYEGLCVVGGINGSVHFLSLLNGHPLHPSVLVGSIVLAIEIHRCAPSSESIGSIRSSGSYHVLLFSQDDQLRVWKFTTPIQDTSRSSVQLEALYDCSLQPIYQSLYHPIHPAPLHDGAVGTVHGTDNEILYQLDGFKLHRDTASVNFKPTTSTLPTDTEAAAVPGMKRLQYLPTAKVWCEDNPLLS